MSKRIWAGFALTVLGAILADAAVLLALSNLLGLSAIDLVWLLAALGLGGVLLAAGWLCRGKAAS
jgi:hypothetical protein